MTDQELATKQDMREIKQDIREFKEEVKQDTREFKEDIKQDTREFREEVKQDTREFREEVKRHFGVVADGLEHKLEMVAEYTLAINNKLDKHIVENRKGHEQLGDKLTQLSVNLSEHRDNTELHGIKRKRKK